MKTLRFTLIVGLFLSLASAPCLAQAPSCPATTAQCGPSFPALPGDQGSKSCDYYDSGGGTGALAFDYALGTSSISYFNEKVTLTTEDTFRFEGPVPGQTINARVSLALNAQACNGDISTVRGTLQLTPGLEQQYEVSAPHPYLGGGCNSGSGTLTQDLAFVSGQAFTIRVILDSFHGAGGSGSISTQLSFEQIPANVVVRSCHGYHQDGPVPAVAQSWGSLKSQYR